MAGEINKSRRVQARILDVLYVAGNFGLSFEQIERAFDAARGALSDWDIQRELAALVEIAMVSSKYDQAVECNYYAISYRGQTFKRAGMPWEKIDEFAR